MTRLWEVINTTVNIMKLVNMCFFNKEEPG